MVNICRWLKLNEFVNPEPPIINILYGWSEICGQFGLCSFTFSFVTSSKFIIFWTVLLSQQIFEDILQEVLKMSWRHLQDVMEDKKLLRWRHLQDVLKTFWRHVMNRSSRRFGDKQNVYWGYLYLTNLNVYLTNLYFTNLYLTNIR